MKDYSYQIRSGFVEYFKKNGHQSVASSPVIPHDDPTLLFNNAGMNQFKDIFLGKSQRDYKRAVTAQKCIRAGGKHNDLENVGHTTRHLTFFEMLGNFSFGDYFKKEAIRFAYEVSTEIFGFEEERIWATVFREDDEAFELWKEYLPESRICRMDEKDNFWAMGDTGPCGPCSELLYDRGSFFSSATSPLLDPSGERFLEFWNLVFMQYNKDLGGIMQKLPRQSIDTGAGLERVVSLKMGVNTVFATDILRDLIGGVEEISGIKYEGETALLAPAFHVIADHIRSLSFAIADGAQPSNTDRGYVLRKILRRAVRYGRILKLEEPFLAKLLPRLINTMNDPYGELKGATNRIAEILTLEEEAFLRTLKRGGGLLNQVMQKSESSKLITGDDAFKLKDTYGLPLDEILLIAKDNALHVDLDRFERLEKEAKERSKKAAKEFSQEAKETLFHTLSEKHGSTSFIGYDTLKSNAKIVAIIKDGALANEASEGDEIFILLDKTPFYAEKGGQVGDRGHLMNLGVRAEIVDTTSFQGLILHKAIIRLGMLLLNETVEAEVESTRRDNIEKNHTATHLLNWALEQVMGSHIKQAGSFVDDMRLRFDFNHHKALTDHELITIEDLVNRKIQENQEVRAYEMSYDKAKERSDIKQFFGDKYGSTVRVVDIDFSKELCGGTHTSRTGNIGLLKILKEGSIAQGVRRLEAICSSQALLHVREQEKEIAKAASLLKTTPSLLLEKIEKLSLDLVEAQKSLKNLLEEKRKNQVESLLQHKEIIGGVSCLLTTLHHQKDELRELSDLLMSKLSSGILLLASQEKDSLHLLVRLSKDLQEKGFDANQLIKLINPLIQGSGGGRADMAQAGGKDKDKIDLVLKDAREWILKISQKAQT